MIYLASKSPRRSELLQDAGIDFKVLVTKAEENFDLNQAVSANAERLSILKAKAALRQIQSKKLQFLPILAADTIVAVEGRMLGKPADKEEATSMLHLLSNNQHSVTTGVTIVNKDIEFHTFSVESLLTFRKISEREIDKYTNTVEPYDKAGGISSQGGAKKFITKIDGSYSNILGLPIDEVLDYLVPNNPIPHQLGDLIYLNNCHQFL